MKAEAFLKLTLCHSSPDAKSAREGPGGAGSTELSAKGKEQGAWSEEQNG